MFLFCKGSHFLPSSVCLVRKLLEQSEIILPVWLKVEAKTTNFKLTRPVEKHWVRPELLEQPELMQVKLTLHIQNESATEPVIEPVSKRQQAVLSAMKQNLSITREILANKLNVSLATLKRELSSLRQKGYIDRSGSDKNGQWVILKNS